MDDFSILMRSARSRSDSIDELNSEISFKAQEQWHPINHQELNSLNFNEVIILIITRFVLGTNSYHPNFR